MRKLIDQVDDNTFRINLNALLRHEVFNIAPPLREGDVGHAVTDLLLVDYVAGRLADAGEIRRSRQFPYQFLAAYTSAAAEVPQKIRAALHQAAETACGNAAELPGPVVIGLNTSGSMSMPTTNNAPGLSDRTRGVLV